MHQLGDLFFFKGVLEEARYFGLESMIPDLEKIVTYCQHNKDNIPLTRRDVINALVATPKDSQLRFQGVNLAGADLSKLDLSCINFKVILYSISFFSILLRFKKFAICSIH